MHTFQTLRETYPVFVYEDYHIDVLPEEVRLTFDFSVPGLAEFHPTTRIPTGALPIVNAPDSGTARAIVFALGLTEAVSYTDGREVSRAVLETAGPAVLIRLTPEKTSMKADGHDLIYVDVEVTDRDGRLRWVAPDFPPR